MMMGDGKPTLWKCTYPNYVEGKINFLEQKVLAEGPVNTQVGLSTENNFRKFAEEHKHLMPDGQLDKTWFNKRTQRNKGCYWNLSSLIIPIKDSKDYYRVAFFS